ncbi:hypothetical protein D3C72_1638710 [compost metagenome]
MLFALFDVALDAWQLLERRQIKALLVANLDAYPCHAVLQPQDIPFPTHACQNLCCQCRCFVHRPPQVSLARQRRA